ncbi:MAG TPA: hypothetical protein VE987_12955 [Polyangiaceae bacterium]|nr:hypothetical protein [Polyangiaceae bacterium]
MKRCPSCGARFTEGACPNCTRVSPNAPPLPSEAKDARLVLLPSCHPETGLLGLVTSRDVLELRCRVCGSLSMSLDGFSEDDLDRAEVADARPVPLSEGVADPELRALAQAYEREAAEWQAIASELARGGESPTAYQVTLAQRKRMLARGDRPVDVERLLARADELALKGGAESKARAHVTRGEPEDHG